MGLADQLTVARVVAVPVVGDEVVVPVEEGAGEDVGDTRPVEFSDADGVGLASGLDDVGGWVAVGLHPGVPPEGDGDTSALPPRFVSVVPDAPELPSG